MMRVFDLNPEVASRLIKCFLVDANVLAWPVQEKKRDELGCNVPWAILLDPTSACNLRCTGCWAAEYGHALNLSYEDICSIIDQGRKLGVHVYIYTGGEPLVRKADLIRICERYPDCAFLCFTNATLIDEAFCQDMIRVANFVPPSRAEGNEHTTDARRGNGTYAKIERAMDLLREHGLPFGISACWTRANADAIATEENMDWMIEKGALFCWYFHFMPVGRASAPELIPTPEQRERMYRFVREMRGKKPLFTMDFQNDGEYVGGCIAGGRRYLHINAAGDVEPCVFVHYSNVNIHDVSLLDALRSPLFMKYYESQPFNTNHLRPCPMLENPDDCRAWWRRPARTRRTSWRGRPPSSCARRPRRQRPRGPRWPSACGPTLVTRTTPSARTGTRGRRRPTSRASGAWGATSRRSRSRGCRFFSPGAWGAADGRSTTRKRRLAAPQPMACERWTFPTARAS